MRTPLSNSFLWAGARRAANGSRLRARNKGAIPCRNQIKITGRGRIEKRLVGRKIVAISYLSHDEAAEIGWSKRPVVLHLDDGTAIFPMCDDEGNDGGALATGYDDLPTVPVMRGA